MGRYVARYGLVAVLLAGCGGNPDTVDWTAQYDQCIQAGNTPVTCDCIIQSLQVGGSNVGEFCD